MTYNQCLRITIMQRRKQLPQSTLLSLSACVLGSLGVGSQTADVANADRMGVVVLAMGAILGLRTGGLDGAVGGDDIVIAAAIPAEGTMVAVDV